ncbi:pyridoxamine 5'-phosphate oxidase family protein [Candidatus Bathyarchaeota archaeon]|nr:pyridoxamine 5'-phosphate oxidase family protein [Candidatus Bathyarchaeota archaeon]
MKKDDALKFLQEAKVGRLGVCQNDQSYVVPVLFVYDAETNAIYIHSSKNGKKIEMIKANPNICFEIDEMLEIILNKSPCNCDVAYRSVIVFGNASFMNSPKAKIKALSLLLKKYSEEANSTINPEMADLTQIIEIKITSITGKENIK